MPSFGYAATVSYVIVVLVGDPELPAVLRRAGAQSDEP